MKKIALIEDNKDVRESTRDILELADYSIVTAENGKDGIELVKKEKPDLIFCDITMPDIDGYTVLTILKKHRESANIPFIFLSAKSEKTDMRKGMNLGADDYITKPFEESELIETIEARLNRSADLIEETEPVRNGKNNVDGFKELERIRTGRKIKTYKKKETIYRFDDYANYVYYINKGYVKSIITDAFSKDFIVDLHGPGEYLGYASVIRDEDYFESAKAFGECEITAIPKADFLDVYNGYCDVTNQFASELIESLRRREERLLLLAYAPVRERLASALLFLKSKSISKNESPSVFSISREDLASFVGTAKESLIRTLSEMKSDGILDTDGQEIKIISETELQRLISM